MKKICPRCRIEKTFIEFTKNKGRKNDLSAYCKECSKDITKNWRENNGEKTSQSSYNYNNSELGFFRRKISILYTPSMVKLSQFNPTCTKKEFEQYFLDYINKHGRNCFYCKEPWTYVVKKFSHGVGRKSTKGMVRENVKNLSFDRLDTSKTYSKDNIIFCCIQCNLSKKDVSISLIKRLHEIITERNL
jgi:hypothetical protein